MNDIAIGSSKGRQFFFFHVATFSLNVALVFVATTFLESGTLTSHLFQWDASINRYFHIAQTDLVWGYWALLAPGLLLGLCIFLAILWFSDKTATRKILEVLGGVICVIGVPAYWLFSAYVLKHRFGWTPFRSFGFYEVVLAFCLSLLASRMAGNRAFPLWISLSALTLHYGFWFWKFETFYAIGNDDARFTILRLLHRFFLSGQ